LGLSAAVPLRALGFFAATCFAGLGAGFDFLVTTGLSSKWSGLTSCCADIEMDKKTTAAKRKPIPGRDGFTNFMFFFSVYTG
jgi:hypothetical protein